MRTEPLWLRTASIPSFPRLAGDLEVDVAVIGAGITGLTAALRLQELHQKVVVLETRAVGAGETGRTSAHLTELLDTRYHTLESDFGKEGARLAAESTRAAIDDIEAVAHSARGGVRFSRVPAYLYAETEEQRQALEREMESLQRVGCAATWTDSFPLPFSVKAAIRVERQAQVHAGEYMAELARAFTQAGGRIFEQTSLRDLTDGEPCEVRTDTGTVRARYVLMATHTPVSNLVAIHTKIASYRTYVIAATGYKAIAPGLYFDMQTPYHYLRTQQTGEGSYLMIGGEDHKTGKDSDAALRFERLEHYLQTHFTPAPQVAYRWSGQIIEPADGLPFIGKNSFSRHVLIATGFSGNGITFGTVAGRILTDIVMGVPNPWAAIYTATRIKPVAAAKDYLKENVDFPLHIVKDRVSRGEVSRVQQIPRGAGALYPAKGKVLAVYRDENDALHSRSAVCPHMGCHVHWNSAEKSWDCPCHGSRFSTEGAVLNGPALRGLKEVTLDEDSGEEAQDTSAPSPQT